MSRSGPTQRQWLAAARPGCPEATASRRRAGPADRPPTARTGSQVRRGTARDPIRRIDSQWSGWPSNSATTRTLARGGPKRRGKEEGATEGFHFGALLGRGDYARHAPREAQSVSFGPGLRRDIGNDGRVRSGT